MANNNTSSEVVDLIHLLCRLCHKRNKLMFSKLDINESEFNLFMSVKNLNKLNILQIANNMDLPQAKVSRIIDKLVKRKFLNKSILTDKRSVTISFTKKGKEMYDLANENKCLGNDRIKEILNNKAYDEFKELLEQLVENYKI